MIAALVLTVAPLAVAPLTAQTDQPLPVRAAEAIAADGVYRAPSADVDAEALRTMVGNHPGFGFVVLSDEPPDASIEFADDVLDATATRAPLVHTVVVVSPTDYGAVSARYSDEAIDAAFDDVVDVLRNDRVSGLDAFADRVPSAGPPLSDSGSDDDGGDGSSFPIGWVLLLVAVVGGSLLLKATGVFGGAGGDEYAGEGESGSWWSSGRRSSWSSRRSFSSSRRRSSSSSSSSRRSSGSRRGRGGGRF